MKEHPLGGLNHPEAARSRLGSRKEGARAQRRVKEKAKQGRSCRNLSV